MGKFLIRVTEEYRCDTEGEAATLIDEAKHDSSFSLTKYTSTHKELKQKGEVVEEWYHVNLTKVFDDEKCPIGSTTIEYNTSESAF